MNKPKRYDLNKKTGMLTEEKNGHWELHEEAEQSRKEAFEAGMVHYRNQFWHIPDELPSYMHDAPDKEADKGAR